MADQIDATIRRCRWRLGGRCFRRMKCRQGEVDGDSASPGLGKPPTVPDLLDFFHEGGSIEEVPMCDAGPVAPCPHLPVFEDLVLSFRGVPIIEFSKRCPQALLLEAFHNSGWLDVLENPLGPPSPHDAENGLSDIIFALNRTLIKASKSRGQRIRVSSVGRSVRWEFVDA